MKSVYLCSLCTHVHTNEERKKKTSCGKRERQEGRRRDEGGEEETRSLNSTAEWESLATGRHFRANLIL